MDIMPSNQGLSMPGTPLLPAEKRKRPSLKEIQQKYARKRTVEVLDAKEIMAKLRGKAAAPVEEIASAAQMIQNNVAAAMTRTSDIDAEDWGEVESSPGDMDGFDPVPAVPVEQPAPQRQAVVKKALTEALSIQSVAQHPADKYLARRQRITMELPDSTVTMSAVDIVHSRCGIVVLLPQVKDGMTFIPKPGSELTLRVEDKTYTVYFPGVSFDLPELCLLGLCFVTAEPASAPLKP